MKTPQHQAKSLSKQPNSRFCFACGLENEHGLQMKFYELGPGEVKATYLVSDSFQGYPGIVHGGVLASMLDEVASRAAMTGEPTRFRFTAKLEIRYRKPAPIGEILHLHGWIVEDKGSRAIAKADIRLEDGTLLTEAEALLADYPAEVDESTLAELGWRVYPD
jgi:acyl-coenzyme A thioesterase PaaI-like protein